MDLKKEKIFNATEKEENQYLNKIKGKVQDALNIIDERILAHSKDVQQFKDYLWENKAGMDHVEKVSVRQSISQTALTGDAAVAKRKRLFKIMASPYFGRLDFIEKRKATKLPVYIGVHSFVDEKNSKNLIYDWRAPISSMFYDYELGDATYEAPQGEVYGQIVLKRQYRIKQGKMEFMLESALNIHDDVLQQELSRASSDRMKNIVATIQRDQNQIIRNDDAQTLIIQGVAGSGKTSIALHRIAFLLYKHKETISSDDILILSPNKVFADYISNVLPELGEELIQEIGIDDLAIQLLENKYKFQSFFDQVSKVIDGKDKEFIQRIEFKRSNEFLNSLNQYLAYIENNFFAPKPIPFGKHEVPASYIMQKFESFNRVPLLKRFKVIADEVAWYIGFKFKKEVKTAEVNSMHKALKDMFRITNIRDIYKEFYSWIDKPEAFKLGARSTLEYSDVFPLIYLKIRLEGVKSFTGVKHLIIDEMQDYTPLQYAVISKLYTCKKTILGDSFQSVNIYSSSTSDQIEKVFPGSVSMKLNKSYRSTFEIIELAQKILPNSELEAVERHGTKPEISTLKDSKQELEKIKSITADFLRSDFNSLGIICKTQIQADALYESIKEFSPKIYALNSQSVSFANGIVITSVHMSKGLEFDQVIVPFVTEKNYSSEVDRRLLYIAITRAMHKLSLTHEKKLSEFLARNVFQM